MLSNDDIDFFERAGYVGPFDLPPQTFAAFMAARSARLRERVEDGSIAFYTTQRGTDTEGHPGYLTHYERRNQHLNSKSLVELVTTPAILDRVRALIGPDILLWVAHVMGRTPGEVGQRWHIDTLNMYVRGIHVSVALSDMNADNGCLRLIPGTHLYRASLDLPISSGAMGQFDDAACVRFADQVAPWHAPHEVKLMQLRAGQFFFMWGGLWHAVGPNQTDRSRIACVARFARTDMSCRAYGPRDNHIDSGAQLPCLLVSGEDRFGLNHLHQAPETDIFD
jgi:hypothetical protein